MTYYYDTFSTRVGDFSAAVYENGAIAATAFGGANALLARFTDKPAVTKTSLMRAPAKLAAVRKQVDEYFAGKRRVFDLPLAPAGGTEHQRRVWVTLSAIPCGETRSYGEIAKKSTHRRAPWAAQTRPTLFPLSCLATA